MEYEPEFTKSFMSRTLVIVNEYQGPYDATLLINCMLGLLVLPKETLLNKLPDAPFDQFSQCGIQPNSIKNHGRCDYGHPHELNRRQLIRRMRNAVSHFRVEPFQSPGNVQGFEFKDQNGFHAKLTLQELKEFVIKLSEYLQQAS